MKGTEGFDEQLRMDACFLCSHQSLDSDLVDRVVLQLNRIYPQILSDKEACKFRNMSALTDVRLAELLKVLQVKGEDACYEFYRALHIHAEDVYSKLPTRVRHREMTDSKGSDKVMVAQERYVLNDRGPVFFLSCFSFAVGIAILYYYGEGEPLRCTDMFLRWSAVGLCADKARVKVLKTTLWEEQTSLPLFCAKPI